MGRKHRHKQAKRSAQVIKLVPKVEPVVAHDVAPCEPQAGYPSSHELKSFGLRMRPEAQGRRAQSALTPATGPMDLQTFQRVFAPAKPPPGVLPAGTKPMAMDDAFPNPFGIAAIANFTENLAWLGYPYLSELAQRPEYRRISETIAREMTRKWIKFQASGNEDKTWKLDAIEAEFKRHQVKDKFRRLAELDGFFGGGHLYIDTGFTENPEELKLPLVVHRSKIRIGGLKLLHVVEPVWTYPGMYNAINPLRADFYKPSQWYVMGQTVHTTRLLPFISRPMPDLLKPAYSFRGLSMSQMAKPYVDNWLRTRQSVSDLIHSFSVSGVKTNLMGVLNGGGGEEETTRANMFINMRDNNGVMMLDKETEEWFNVSTPLTTLDHLQAQSQEHMCSVSGIPLVIFTGITPSGLNASSEEEIAVWNTWIEATQEHLFREHLMTLLRIVQLSLFGEIDPEIDFKFAPLAEPTAKEEAEIELAKAQVDAAYINIGVIGPNEARERLAADEDSPYDGLEIDMPMPGMIDPVTGLPIEQDPLATGGQVVDNGQQPQAVSQNEPPMQQPAGGAVSNQYPLGQAHDAAWNESDHPRGQPDNAGQFAKGSGGGKNAGRNEGEGLQPGGGRASGGGIPDERSGRHDRANQERSAGPDTESDHRGNAPHVLALTKHIHLHEGGNVDLHELEKGEESAALFHKAISKAGAAVHVYEPEEYKNMRLFLAPDALGGFALKGNDIVSVFKDPKAPYKRFALTALEMGVAQGGRRLDCFDTVLPHFYSKNNFRAVARIPFVDEYAPEGWDYEGMKDFNNGRPDVVFMVYDPEAGPYRPDDGEKVEDYDKAVAIQQKEVARIKKEWPDMVEEPHKVPDDQFIPGDSALARDAWNEADHPRGQPENKGEFAKAPGGNALEAGSTKIKEQKTKEQFSEMIQKSRGNEGFKIISESDSHTIKVKKNNIEVNMYKFTVNGKDVKDFAGNKMYIYYGDDITAYYLAIGENVYKIPHQTATSLIKQTTGEEPKEQAPEKPKSSGYEIVNIPEFPKLTDEENRVAVDYTGSFAYEINGFLRNVNKGLFSEDDVKKYNALAETLDRATKKAKIKSGITLYRGVPTEVVRSVFGNEIREGGEIIDPAFLSTSKANRFGSFGNEMAIIEIETDEETRGLDVNNISAYKNEREVILPRGTRLIIKEVDVPDPSEYKPLVIKCQIAK